MSLILVVLPMQVHTTTTNRRLTTDSSSASEHSQPQGSPTAATQIINGVRLGAYDIFVPFVRSKLTDFQGVPVFLAVTEVESEFATVQLYYADRKLYTNSRSSLLNGNLPSLRVLGSPDPSSIERTSIRLRKESAIILGGRQFEVVAVFDNNTAINMQGGILVRKP